MTFPDPKEEFGVKEVVYFLLYNMVVSFVFILVEKLEESNSSMVHVYIFLMNVFHVHRTNTHSRAHKLIISPTLKEIF